MKINYQNVVDPKVPTDPEITGGPFLDVNIGNK